VEAAMAWTADDEAEYAEILLEEQEAEQAAHEAARTPKENLFNKAPSPYEAAWRKVAARKLLPHRAELLNPDPVSREKTWPIAVEASHRMLREHEFGLASRPPPGCLPKHLAFSEVPEVSCPSLWWHLSVTIFRS
jgi:hypothetical protein